MPLPKPEKIHEDDPCPICGSMPELRICDVCGNFAFVVDCEHKGQPRPIDGATNSETGQFALVCTPCREE